MSWNYWCCTWISKLIGSATNVTRGNNSTIVWFIFFGCCDLHQAISQLLEGPKQAALVLWKEKFELFKLDGSETFISRYEYGLCCWKETGCKSGQYLAKNLDVTHTQKLELNWYHINTTMIYIVYMHHLNKLPCRIKLFNYFPCFDSCCYKINTIKCIMLSTMHHLIELSHGIICILTCRQQTESDNSHWVNGDTWQSKLWGSTLVCNSTKYFRCFVSHQNNIGPKLHCCWSSATVR